MQLFIHSDEPYFLICGRRQDIAWNGLQHRLRVDVTAWSDARETSSSFSDLKLHIVGSVKGDGGTLVPDVLEEGAGKSVETAVQSVYIAAKIAEHFPKMCRELKLRIRVFASHGFADEEMIFERSVDVSVRDYMLPDVSTSEFYMDLWQHPCNWARAYGVPYYGEEHMQIIDRYLEGMSKLGQKVCDLIISDYPWAGQRCYLVPDNHNNLFELNMIRVSKDEAGNLVCDFRALDAYVELARKHNMAEEINLFGILCNWDAYSFGNPIEDFYDPIRISYFDQKDGVYRYFRTVKEVETYLRLVFAHLDELGLWERTLIMSDEPSNVAYFQESLDLFERAADGKHIALKCAIHDQTFFQNHADSIKSLSLNTCELIHNIDKMEDLRAQVEKNGGTLTWYSCCFPTELNVFLKSPLMESRLTGWFTYYMHMHGFLRWAYGVWPGDVYRDAAYKPEKWAAGDMFFVYPGKNMRPAESLRLKNLLYGVQDYLLLKSLEDVLGREAVVRELEPLLGARREMRYLEPREVELHHSVEESAYLEVRERLMDKAERYRDVLRKISDCIVEMDEDEIIPSIERALSEGVSAELIQEQGLSDGMLRVTKLFEEKEYYVSEVIVCADTLNKGIGYLKSRTSVQEAAGPKIVLGVVEGDLHEIGKNIVKIMFEAAGFRVIDMGLNVRAEEIVQKAMAEKADVIGLSTMMTTTMGKMADVVSLLKAMNCRIPKVIIGGGCISERYCREIGADGYSPNAVEAVKLVRKLVSGASEESPHV
ncbi:MAG: cobalamin-dependent protein [Bacillota bacterium]|nr:cobalamin-dependent protein [Bacillota bacterium]